MDQELNWRLPDERVLWRGQPGTGLLIRPVDVGLIPFSLMWGGFAIFWNVQVWSAPHGGLPFQLFGLPFLVIGLYMIAGRFLADIWLRRRMNYYVTDRRIIIERGGPFPALQSVDLRRLPALDLSERPDNSGTIRFGLSEGTGRRGFGMWMPALDRTPQFLAIPKVREVYALIERAQR